MSRACDTVVAIVSLRSCRCDRVVPIVSWPGLARPPTTLPPPAPPVVDGRPKAGHDTRGEPARYSNACGVAGLYRYFIFQADPAGLDGGIRTGHVTTHCRIVALGIKHRD